MHSLNTFHLNGLLYQINLLMAVGPGYNQLISRFQACWRDLVVQHIYGVTTTFRCGSESHTLPLNLSTLQDAGLTSKLLKEDNPDIFGLKHFGLSQPEWIKLSVLYISKLIGIVPNDCPYLFHETIIVWIMFYSMHQFK